MSTSDALPSTALSYTIEACSSYSASYVPENIMVDRPSNQTSRWSGQSKGVKKPWVMVKLSAPSIVKAITFGKYHKPHPCNVKEFVVFGGMTPDNMTEILHDGLRNDPIQQTFTTVYQNSKGICFPCRFLKVVTITAHNQSYNTSIWFLRVEGIDNADYVRKMTTEYTVYREAVTLRLMLKHLRQSRHFGPYKQLLATTGISLEHPTVTAIYNNLVLDGNWSKVEELLHSAGQEGLFDFYIHESQPTPVWQRIHDTNADGDVPSRRGGHQLCLDSASGLIYLFGGWDGTSSLADLWVYSIADRNWRILSQDTSKDGGPRPRSCHKIVFDSQTGHIYVLGHYETAFVTTPDVAPDPSSTQPTANIPAPIPSDHEHCCDFYRYSTKGLDAGNWQLISKNAAVDGGPALIFDHQMTIDIATRTLYVFGGRIVDNKSDIARYSGMYSYHIETRKWNLLFDADVNLPSPQRAIPSRIGHSMLLEPNSKTLYIFAGKRLDAYLSDMHTFSLVSHEVTEVFGDFTSAGGPRGCFAQRSAIDPHHQEIYILSGLSGDSVGNHEVVKSSFWIYRYKSRKWLLAHRPVEENTKEGHAESAEETEREPKARYAHQLVYDPSSQTFFLFGGNSGTEERLDDFWKMTLTRTSPHEVCRLATFQIRKQQFSEMCEDASPLKALNFLSNTVSDVVNHDNADESANFRSLLAPLLARLSSEPLPPTGDAITNEDIDMGSSSRPSSPIKPAASRVIEPQRFSQRTALFEVLLSFISPEHKQPDANILDLIKLDSDL